MSFVDEITIYAKAGKGGDGVMRMKHEKYKEFAGPCGGDGGNGGDVYARGVRNVHLLSKHRHQTDFFAEQGGDGGSDSLHGANGEDFDIELPVGSIVTNQETGESFNLLHDGERVLMLKGGRGGRGNESFKSSTNQAPREFTLGKEPQEGNFYVELQLVADAGFIGLPNAGKSSLLNALTRAKAKIGAYAFTTLEPNLGEYYGYILADIPGLIEGAGEGKGLGHKFLRHVKRTHALVHLVSLENENLTEAYQTIRKELAGFDPELARKKEIVVLTKTDVVTPEVLKEKIKEIKKLVKKVYTISCYDDESIKAFGDALIQEIKEAE